MKPHKIAKLLNTHAGDRVKVTFNTPSDVYLMTEENFEIYKNDGPFVRHYSQGAAIAYFDVPFDGDWIIVIEPLSNNVEFKGSFKIIPVVGSEWNDVNGDSVIVHNAVNTAEKDVTDMADYWEEQKNHKLAGNDLICRSCHNKGKRCEIDGAHVKLSHVTNSKTYIVPTCNSCNRSRQDKDFIVPASWLVEAPK